MFFNQIFLLFIPTLLSIVFIILKNNFNFFISFIFLINNNNNINIFDKISFKIIKLYLVIKYISFNMIQN